MDTQGARRCALALGAALLLALPLRALDPEKSVFQFNCQNWTRASGLPADRVSVITQTGDGYIWLGTPNGLVRFDGLKFEVVPIELAGAQGHDVVAMAGSRESGLVHPDAGRAVPFADGELEELKIQAVATDLEGRLWVGTDRGLRSYDADGGQKRILPGTVAINALLVDRHGILWVGTAGEGLARYADGKLTHLRESHGLGSDIVTSLLVDAEGSLWVGTAEGLSQLTDLKFPLFSKEEGIIQGGTLAVAASQKGGLWIGGVEGASYFDGRNAINYTDPALLPNRYVRRIFEAANGDVYLSDGDRNVNVLTDGQVSARYVTATWNDAFAEDEESVLLSMGAVLHRVRNGRLENFPLNTGQKVDFIWINNIAVAKTGAIWMATNDGLIRIVDGNTRHWSTAQGLSTERVHCLVEDANGAIWAGLPTGMARIKDDVVVNVGEPNGLYDARVYAIVPDDHGFFWISSGRGIFRVAHQALNDFADGKVAHVVSESFDGIESMKFIDRTDQDYSGCKTLDGRVWFPNPHGVVMVDPLRFFTNKIPPPVHLQQVRINGVELQDRSRTAWRVGDRNVEFHFAALSYIAPAKVRMQYQLVGFDPEWVDAGERRSVLYNDLAPGRYAFRLKARNADGLWSAAGADFVFTLPPPYFKTTWFYVLCGLAAVLIFLGAYRWKVWHMEIAQENLRSQNDLLEARVEERTSELAYERDLLRTLMDHSPDHIYFKDAQSRFLKSSMAQAASFGMTSPDELVGRTALEFVAEDHAREAFEDEQEIIRTGRPLIGKIEEEVWSDGRKPTWKITSKLPLHNKANEIVGTFGISKDITAIKESEAQLLEVHKQLLESSRRAGMAEVATGVLHNVGNVLNSVNVSATLVMDRVRQTRAGNIAKLAVLFDEHKAGLGDFLARDPRGQMIPGYLTTLAEGLAVEQAEMLVELDHLRKNVEHIKYIVSMQQTHARNSGTMDSLSVVEMVEDALQIKSTTLAEHEVELVRDYQARPLVKTDKHKVMQILINLVRNARHACNESGGPVQRMIVRITEDEFVVRIAIIDNGVGIPAENLTRIFAHGFTTRAHGHGFGLHSSALTAKELGGSISAESDGPGLGATFVLELPIKPAPAVAIA